MAKQFFGGWQMVATLGAILLQSVALAASPSVHLSTAPGVDPDTAWSSYYLLSAPYSAGPAAPSVRGPEIKKLARALGSNRYGTDAYAAKIFDYVRFNIATEFRMGLGKGARGALVDQSGTPFDQAQLMVELLREGGVSGVSYQVGKVTLTAAEFGKWTGLVYNLDQAAQTFSVDAKAACQFLADGGIPATVNGSSSCATLSGVLTSVTMMHVWVMANGKFYDPSFKRMTLRAGVNVASAMGCDAVGTPICGNTLDSDGGATPSTTAGAPSIANINRAAIDARMNTWSQSLQSYIESNDRFWQVEDVAGGQVADLTFLPAIPASLPSNYSSYTTWTGEIPNRFRTVFTVSFLGINQPNLYADELFGRRLRVATLGASSSWSRTSRLYVEDQVIATATVTGDVNTIDMVTLTIDHPYAANAAGGATLDGTYADETLDLYAGEDIRNANREYVYDAGTVQDAWPNTISVVWALGHTGPGYQSLIAALQATASGQITLTESYGYREGLAASAAGILVQESAATRLVESLSKSKLTVHHTVGVAYSTYRLDTTSGQFNIVSNVSANQVLGNATDRGAAFTTYALAASVIEGSVPQQAEDGWEAITAATMLWRANEDHEAFLELTCANLPGATSTLQSNGYNATRLAALNTYLCTNGFNVVLPLKSALPAVTLSGGQMLLGNSGEIAYKADAIGYTISETLKGNQSVASGENPFKAAMDAARLTNYSVRGQSAYSLDPAEGSINLTPLPDLVVGTGRYPASLHFQRTYSSSESSYVSCSLAFGPNFTVGTLCEPQTEGTSRTTLGNGWRHNFQISAEWVNNGSEALGSTNAVRASRTLASLYAMFDLARTGSLSRRLAGVFVAYSMSASFMKNSFNIRLPEKSLTFVKLPNGTYDAPLGDLSAQLVTNGSRSAPLLFGQSVLFDYTSTTLQYRSGRGDVMNFGWNTMTYIGSSPAYPIIKPTFEITDWSTPDGIRVTFAYREVFNSLFNRRHRELTRVSNNLGRYIDIITSTYGFSPISSIADGNGRTVSFGRNCTNTPTFPNPNSFTSASFAIPDCIGDLTVTGVDQGVTRYSYAADTDSPDPAGALVSTVRLRKVFTPSSSTSPYVTVTYDEGMSVKTIVDAEARTSYVYSTGIADESARSVERVDPTGALTSSFYDRFGNLLTSVDGLGRVTNHYYDNGRRRVETKFPEGNGERYQYDVRSNLRSTTYYSKPGSGLADLPGTSTIYSEGVNVRTCANPVTCNRPASVQDANGNTTSYSYDPTTGQLLTETGPAVTNGVVGNALTTLCYTPYSTSNGAVSLLTGRIVKVTGSLNRVTTYSYNPTNGYVLDTVTVDPSNSLTPPAQASPTCPTTSKSGAFNLATTFAFDAIGNIQSINGPRTDVADTTAYTFDNMRRLTRVDAPLSSITRYTFDVDGQLTGTRRALVVSPTDASPANPRPTDLVASQWQLESRTYWPAGDLKSVSDTDGHTTEYQYDGSGRQILVTDPESRRTGTVYDNAGQVICTYRGWGSTTAPSASDCSTWIPAAYTSLTQPVRYAAYTYTMNGKQASIQDAGNNITDYGLDGFDRLIFTAFADPSNGTRCTLPSYAVGTPTCSGQQTYEKQTFDNNGNRLTFRNRAGETITFTYDAANRLWTKSVPNLPTITSAYNLANEVISASSPAYASPAFGSIPAHAVGYDYDAAGRKSYEENLVAGATRRVSYLYDEAGSRSRTTWADGYFIAYQFDDLNRLRYVRENSTATNELAFYEYDILSRRNQLTLAGQATNRTTYTYEPDDDLDLLTNILGGTTVTLDFGHNGAGQISSIEASDGFYLPARAMGTAAYSPNGLNQYSAVGADSVSSDARGNLTSWVSSYVPPGGSAGRQTYVYDAENRLRTAAVGGSSTATITYDYDPLGRRLSKTVSGEGSVYYLLDDAEEIAELDGTGAVLRRYVMGGAIDERIAQADGSATTSPTKTYYHVDHHGSVVAATDASGAIQQRISYDEFGNLSAGSVTTGQQFRYTGRRFDPETGLYYYRARYYAPQLGRFLQVDPKGIKDDFNLYAYVGNDPLDRTDPSGQFNCVHTAPNAVSCTALGLEDAMAMLAYAKSQNWTPTTVSTESSEADSAGKSDSTPKSPVITPGDLTGKSKEEIEKLAKDKGLVQDPKKPTRYRDPVTGKERIRIDPGHIDPKTGKPYDDPRAAAPHVHGYGPNGKTKVVDPETGNPHFPLQELPETIGPPAPEIEG